MERGKINACIWLMLKTIFLNIKSSIQVQFLLKAVEILWESRKQLMFTFIFAYFVQSHPQKELFENNQHDLEQATEALSRYFEQDLTKDNVNEIQSKVLDKSRWAPIDTDKNKLTCILIIRFQFTDIVRCVKRPCKSIFSRVLRKDGGHSRIISDCVVYIATVPFHSIYQPSS